MFAYICASSLELNILYISVYVRIFSTKFGGYKYKYISFIKLVSLRNWLRI